MNATALRRLTRLLPLVLPACLLLISPPVHAADDAAPWRIGTPIVTYWAGPAMTDAAATQLAEGGWNLVWCRESELETAHRHGLRALVQDGLLTPASLDDPAKKAALGALVERVRKAPAAYAYFITDEPSAAAFPALGRLVAFLKERDPGRLAYINLFPTYANNEQLGTRGDFDTAYRDHLRLFVEQVKPALLSYDHYHFSVKGDGEEYFLNIAMMRHAAQKAGVPFLNIVQACTWTPGMRVPQADEVRWLVSTTLAYGAQGLSYYVYGHPGHTGGFATLDGKPLPLYEAAKTLNRDFVAIATELQPLRSLAVYHAGMIPPGGEPLPSGAAVRIEPPVAARPYAPPKPIEGVVLGYFGTTGTPAERPSHVVVVNLDYRKPLTTTVVGPGPLQSFDPSSRSWTPLAGGRVELPPGGCRLVRVGSGGLARGRSQ